MSRWAPALALAVAACGAPSPAAVKAPAPPVQPAPTVRAPAPAPPVAAAVPAPAAVPGPVTVPPPAPAPAPAPAPKPPDGVTFVTVGDIMLSRGVAAAIDKADDPLLPFRGMASILDASDFNFGNLESPFSSSDAYKVSRAQVFNTPKRNVAGLVKHKFTIVNLANNHALDRGLAGLRITLKHLHDQGIKTIGVGETVRAAWRTEVVEVKGIRVGFVGASYASVNDSGKTWLDYVARIEDQTQLKRAIAKLRKRADFIVATMHAGIEYVETPFGPQKLFAHAAIRFGADIVLAAHPHVVQHVEKYRGKWVFYSLGNFIFDHTRPHTRDGAAVRTTLRRGDDGKVGIGRLEVIPFVIENLSTPRPASEAEAGPILKRMKLDRRVLVGE